MPDRFIWPDLSDSITPGDYPAENALVCEWCDAAHVEGY